MSVKRRNTKMGKVSEADIVDHVAVQNALLNVNKEQAEFLKTLQPPGLDTTFGVKSKPRGDDPTM